MISELKNLWKSNLILSEIPWNYYLHPCPKLYAEELSDFGPTLWINPPTRNPLKTRLIVKRKNLIIFTPLIFKRSSNDSGFNKFEVRLQIKVLVSIFLRSASSVWSISTAYPHLLDENPAAKSIFWSGDFFSPEKEFISYKNFDLVLCLTPQKYEKVPRAFKGGKLHFHMCAEPADKSFKKSSREIERVEAFTKRSSSFTKVAGYVGTLSSLRFDFEVFLTAVDKLPNVLFVVIGKSDSTHKTDFLIQKMLSFKNVHLIDGMPYNHIHSAIACFDICLIPYKLDLANLGTCPTKFIDYCTSGKTILSTNLPGLRKFGDLCSLASDKEEFCEMIKSFDPSNNPLSEDRIELARKSSPIHFLKKFQNCLT